MINLNLPTSWCVKNEEITKYVKVSGETITFSQIEQAVNYIKSK